MDSCAISTLHAQALAVQAVATAAVQAVLVAEAVVKAATEAVIGGVSSSQDC